MFLSDEAVELRILLKQNADYRDLYLLTYLKMLPVSRVI